MLSLWKAIEMLGTLSSLCRMERASFEPTEKILEGRGPEPIAGSPTSPTRERGWAEGERRTGKKEENGEAYGLRKRNQGQAVAELKGPGCRGNFQIEQTW